MSNDLDCGSLVHPANGTVTHLSSTVGIEARYTCLVGFDLVGNNTRICLDNGNWSHVAPECRIKGNKLTMLT